MTMDERPHLYIVPDPDLYVPEEEDIDDSGTETGDSSAGSGEVGGPLIDPSVFGLTNHLFLELLRQEERKFSKGWVPVTKPPVNPTQGTGYAANGPPLHPLLSQSSQFSGDDKKVSANPPESEQGQENYKKYEHVYTPAPRHTHVANPTPSVPTPRPL